MTREHDSEAVRTLAGQHGLPLDSDSISFNEAGLDYRVAFATHSGTGGKWVLRIPRRPDVSAKVGKEQLILDFVRPRLSVAVPDWRIRTPDLIAYPALPGGPGLTLDAAGQPLWHFDTASPLYARSFAELIASLHLLDATDAAAEGVPAETPEQARRRWATDLDRVLAEFDVDPALVARWRAWIDDDDLWPERTVFTHGELYPAHLLLDEENRILSVLDWTTAKVADPALDFMLHHMISPPDVFTATVDAYRGITGRSEPFLAARCEAILAAGPLNYALFAMETGAAEHRATAVRQLRP